VKGQALELFVGWRGHTQSAGVSENRASFKSGRAIMRRRLRIKKMLIRQRRPGRRARVAASIGMIECNAFSTAVVK
jgi:hypothetical protein